MLRIYGLALAAVLLACVLALAHRWHRAVLPSQPLWPLAFDHADHIATSCTQCHHNFVDGSGGGSCLQCHKSSPEVVMDIETRFHAFCRDCHLAARDKGEASGPVHSCATCHPKNNYL